MAMKPIQVTINGVTREIQPPMNLRVLLASLGLEGKPVVVEINNEPVFPRDHANHSLIDGSIIEIVTLTAGG